MQTIGETLGNNSADARPSPLRGLVRKAIGYGLRPYVQRMLNRVQVGRLTVVLPDGMALHGGSHGTGGEATLLLHRWRAIFRLILGGDLGFAEAYMANAWSTPDLLALLTLGDRNAQAFDGRLNGTIVARILARIAHLASKNTKRGSRRNIRAHYDLGNDFYAMWLDAGMSYSSAMFAANDMTLEAAQRKKQDRLLQLLDMTPGMNVLEIGCGWGGLMERIAQAGGCVTGLTLSPAQADYANTRLIRAKLTYRTEIRLEDYRDCKGMYDRIVSVEMFEAVGVAYWPIFFDVLNRRLSPDGTAVLQIITIDEQRFPAYVQQADFIQKHIFPGGMLPTRSKLAEGSENAGLAIEEIEHFGLCYARTLAEWALRFERAWPRLRDMGFDEKFRRKWLYYLAYCEAGCRTGTLNVGLYRFTKRIAA